MIVGQGHRSR